MTSSPSVASDRLNWGCQGAFDTPPVSSDSLTKQVLVDARLFGPFNQRLSFAVVRDLVSVSRVSRLGFRRRPSHIAWRVPKRIVDSVERVTLFAIIRKICYVVIEGCKRSCPFIAYSNAAPSIASIGLILRVGASPDDRVVHPVQMRARFAVRRHYERRRFCLQATTRARLAHRQVGRTDHGGVSAFTAAQPFNFSVGIMPNGAERSKASECLTRNIFCPLGKNDKLGLHENLHFSAKPGTVDAVARHFILGCFYFILPHLNECGNEASKP